jgi:hypothetical protein
LSERPTDIVWGAEQIAATINLSVAATYHLLERRRLPAKKIGAKWCANRQALFDALTKVEAA